MTQNHRSGETKKVGRHSLLYVMAAAAEYGPELKKLITPLICGVGPVESAIALTARLSQLQTDQSLPDLVVSLGSAGSNHLPQTGIFQAHSVSYRDMDASVLGFEPGVTPFVDLPATLDLGLPITGIEQASLSTGANVVSGSAYDTIDADMVDMESFALTRACQHFEVPIIIIRGISDGRDDLNHIDDWTRYLHIIDAKIASAVQTLEQQIRHGQFLKQ